VLPLKSTPLFSPVDRDVTRILAGPSRIHLAFFLVFSFFLAGCAALFGWKIHAPGVLSKDFEGTVTPKPYRIALYVPPESLSFQSKDKGGKTADPQTYFIGESFGPMAVEAFQSGFEEFIFMEVPPTPEILKHYGISYLVVTGIVDFHNKVTWKTQTLQLITQTVLLDPELHFLARFESAGQSKAQNVFGTRGGPEVNLNAAIENNVVSLVQYLQDYLARISQTGQGVP